jgi:hypothetical protein
MWIWIICGIIAAIIWGIYDKSSIRSDLNPIPIFIGCIIFGPIALLFVIAVVIYLLYE